MMRWLLPPITLLVALLLMMMPLPDMVRPLRPDWVALVALYWAFAVPARFGLLLAWIAGLLVDVSQGTLLGQHALGLVLITAIALNMHQRVRVSPIAQQAAFVMLLLLVKQVLVLWVSGMIDLAPENLWLYFGSPFVAVLFWPLVFVILRDLRRRYHVG